MNTPGLSIPRSGPRDERLVLRPYEPYDAHDLFEAAHESIVEMEQWMPWCHEHYALGDSEAYIARTMYEWDTGTEYSFCIRDARAGRFLGGCGINRLDLVFGTANLGYWVRSSAAGHGIATRASSLLLRWAFEILALRRIEIVCGLGNRGSRRVAEHLGGVPEALLRERLIVRGQPHDAVLYSVLKADFR